MINLKNLSKLVNLRLEAVDRKNPHIVAAATISMKIIYVTFNKKIFSKMIFFY
jgi:hypothetical protein